MHNQKCPDTNYDVNLLQIRSMPIGAGLSSPATLLFNRPIGDPLFKMNREPLNIDNNDAQYEALKAHYDKYIKGTDTNKDSLSFHVWSTVAM